MAGNGQVDAAVSTILGGIALQTVVLVALDASVPIQRPLTDQAASLPVVLEGDVVEAVLVACVMGAELPRNVLALRLSPDVIGVAVL